MNNRNSLQPTELPTMLERWLMGVGVVALSFIAVYALGQVAAHFGGW